MKKGFTLIEVLIVIALLAVLVIIAVPNVLKLVEKSKKNMFLIQAQNIYKQSIQEYVISKEEYNPKNRFYYSEEDSENKLELSGNKNIYYEVEIYSNKVTKFIVWDKDHIIELYGDIALSDITLQTLASNIIYPTQAVAGYNNIIYLLNNKTARGIGYNYNNQLSTGIDGGDKSYATQTKKDAKTFFTDVKSVAASTMFSIFLMEDGTVWGVGYNYSKQLGDGTQDTKYIPVQVKKDANTYLTNVKAISAGEAHTVFLLENGTVWAVGNNGYGQLGDGTTSNNGYAVQVKKDASTYLTNVTSISAGCHYTIFILEDKTVWAVGYNNYGQLGNRTTTNSSYPVQVKKDASTYLTNVKAASAGFDFSTFLLEDGTVWSVGFNNDGQLGDGTTTNNSSLIQVKKDASTYLTNVKAISAGRFHAMFLLENKTAWAVGDNLRGQLGDGTLTKRLYAVQVKKDASTYFTDVAAVSAGNYNNGAILLEDGTAFGLGENRFGQLGNGTTSLSNSYPVQVKKDAGTYLTNIKSIATANSNSLFLLEDGTAWAAGSNSSGQLGDNTSITCISSKIKKDASTYLTNVKSITTFTSHTIFLLEDGTAWAVGNNGSGQLGDGTTTNRSYPVQVKKDADTYLTDIKAVLGVSSYSVFLLEDGTVWSVGWNYYGQLGDGTTTNRSYAVQMKKDASTYVTNVKSVSIGTDYSVLLLEDGTAWAVGKNIVGQLGDGTTTNRSYPVQVKKDSGAYLTNVKAITSSSHTVFLLEDGTVWNTGYNTYGQLGDGTTTNRSYAVQVKKNASTYLTNVKSISLIAGAFQTHFLLEDGTIWGVGFNGYGRLGDGTTTTRSYAVQVKKNAGSYLTNVKSMATTNNHSVFLLEDGTAWGVGFNKSGQLGDGTTTNRSYAVQVKKDASTYLTNVNSIFVGSSFSVFFLEDGTIWSVGDNISGQLGDGTQTNKLYPVQTILN